MGTTLIIAEKPSVAADIAKVVGASDKSAHAYEGAGYVVSWAVGHLLEFVSPEGYDESLKRWRLKDLPIIPDEFRQEPVRGTTKQLNALKKFLKRKDVERVVNACDAGREGELIFREIYRYGGVDKPVDRLWLQSMTAAAIQASVNDPRSSDDVQGLADAADCRAESDWLIGMNATRALTVRLRSKRDKVVWSAGRVQTATLAILVQRERQILDHEPEPFWQVHATFKTLGESGHAYAGTWFDPAGDKHKDRIFEEATKDALLERMAASPALSAEETRKDKRDRAPALFDLTSLQRDGNSKFGYSARRTLSAAQALYEQHKLITYPRTDSKALPSDYREHVEKALHKLSGDKIFGAHAKRLIVDGLQNEERNFDDTKISDHFAIIPTGAGSTKGLSGDAAKLYGLIVRRFLASFHPPSVSTVVERTTKARSADGAEDLFRSRGSYLKVPGWRAVFGKEVESEDGGDTSATGEAGGGSKPSLPPLEGDVDVTCQEAHADAKETKPPARLKEAGLLTLMETAGRQVDGDLGEVLKQAGGLGTPATRADTIETLLAREYASRCTGLDGKRSLRATARGIRLVEALERIDLPQFTTPEMTAQWEQNLREVESKALGRSQYMAEMRAWTEKIVNQVRDFSFDDLFSDDPPIGDDPVHGQPVLETLRAYSVKTEKGELSPFIIWKEIGGRFVDRKSAEQLVKSGETPYKAGFFSRDDKEYEARLVLEGEPMKARIKPRNQQEGTGDSSIDVEPLDIGPCPLCEVGLIRRGPRGYCCEEVDPEAKGDAACKKISLPLELCKRPLSPEEITLLTSGERKTALLEGFISKRNRPFSATLVLSDTGRIKWEFPPRGDGAGGAAGKEFPVNEAPLGKCPLCKEAEVREAPTKWDCAGDDCKVTLPREVCSREIVRSEAEKYFSDKETAELEGFVSKKGNAFSATLYMKRTGRHGFRFAER